MPILLVKVADNDVEETPYRWKAGQIIEAFDDNHEFSTAELPAAGNFYHVAVTDRTLEEVYAYLQSWNHNPTVEQISNQGNLRLIEVTSSMISATGKNAFTQSGVEALLASIGGTYVSHTNTSFRFSIEATPQEAPDIIRRIERAVYGMQFARRRWYITQSGMTYLANNGGTVSGTAAQVSGYLRDGLLD